MEKCPRFSHCSINTCPIDMDAPFRRNLPDEDCCPFTIKKKRKGQKGIKTLATHNILKFIPKSNLKMLNKRNRKQWLDLYNIKIKR